MRLFVAMLCGLKFGCSRGLRIRARATVAVAALLLSGYVSQVHSQTHVTGSISANTRWATDAGPYLISGDVVIRDGARLTVDAGVTIYMGDGASLSVDAGSLLATGTVDHPIRVLSDKVRLGQAGGPGDWNQWVINPGAINTRLEHVRFEHGKGLSVHGAAPVLNYLDFRNHAGAAISIDLAASPSGEGLKATGNTLNGIAVPPGDITGNVAWGLRGIPYVVSSGVVSVGVSPEVVSVTPSTLERDRTATLTVSGSRLEGAVSAVFDRSGLTATPMAGGSAIEQRFQVEADALAELGGASLTLQVDAGEIVVQNALTVTQPLPGIDTISPDVVMAGSGPTVLEVVGRNFTAQSETLVGSLPVTTEYVSDTQLRATLPNQTSAASLPIQVRTPDPLNAGQHLVSGSVNLTVQAAVPPTISFEPALIALPPDGKAHDITLRLSAADFREHTIHLWVGDPSRATVSPATLIIAAGQTTAQIQVTPIAAGVTTLRTSSAILASVNVPLYVTTDYPGLGTRYAAPVGVVVEGGGSDPVYTSTSVVSRAVGIVVGEGGVTPNPVQHDGTLTAPVVGVTVGEGTANPVQTRRDAVARPVGVVVGSGAVTLSPAGWVQGASGDIVVTGFGLTDVASVQAFPSDGVVFGAPAVNWSGTALTVPITASPDAPATRRQLRLATASGELVWVDAAGAVFSMIEMPTITSITPHVIQKGAQVTLTVRGSHLQTAVGASLSPPDDDVVVEGVPQWSSDELGELLTIHVRASALAMTGDRVLLLEVPGGTTSDAPDPNNTLQVVAAP